MQVLNFFKDYLAYIVAGLLGCSLVLNFLNYGIPTYVVYINAAMVLWLLIKHMVDKQLFKYCFYRFLEAALSLFAVASITFILLRILPGGPFDQEKALPPEIKANIEAKYHLNEPLLIQYGLYLKGLLQGDLGESYKYLGRPVTDILTSTAPISFQLGLYALVVAFALGIPAGLFAAAKHNQWWDRFFMFLSVSGVSLPSFFVAPLLIYIFCFYFQWLPPAFWEGTSYYILPSIVLGVRPAAVIARLMRSSVLDVIQSDYIRTAKAKGLRPSIVLFKHVLKNSVISVLTFSGPLIAGILSGSFIVELIFAIPGMGRHLIQSVSNRDYPLILGMTLFFSALLIVANLIVDLLYSYFDPRMKLSA